MPHMTPTERIDLIKRATAVLVKLKDGEATVVHENPSETWERGVNTVLDELEILFEENDLVVIPHFLSPKEEKLRQQLIVEYNKAEIAHKDPDISRVSVGKEMSLGRQIDKLDEKEWHAMQKWWRQRRFAMRHCVTPKVDLLSVALEIAQERDIDQDAA